MDEIKKPEHLTKYIEKTKYRVFVPFVVLNYPFRWLAYVLDKVAFLKILEYVSLLGVIVAVYFYVSESGERLKAKHYQAWQVINAAQGKPGNGGRTDALQDLCNDGVSLANIDLSFATIPGLSLKNADLEDANLSGADIRSANLHGARLRYANLSRADLRPSGAVSYWMDTGMVSNAGALPANLSRANLEHANLSRAHLDCANLSGAGLSQANLSGALLGCTDLSGARLPYANLSGAILWQVNLYGADLSQANLYEADLTGADLRQTNLKDIQNWNKIKRIKLANICRVADAPEGFIEWAKEHGAVSIESDNEWDNLLREEGLLQRMKSEIKRGRPPSSNESQRRTKLE
jgi:uncharacterized protein YjbI with pentapeptide repeats